MPLDLRATWDINPKWLERHYKHYFDNDRSRKALLLAKDAAVLSQEGYNTTQVAKEMGGSYQQGRKHLHHARRFGILDVVPTGRTAK